MHLNISDSDHKVNVLGKSRSSIFKRKPYFLPLEKERADNSMCKYAFEQGQILSSQGHFKIIDFVQFTKKCIQMQNPLK